LKEFLDYRSSHEGGIANLGLLPNGGNSSTNVRMQSAKNFRTNLETSNNRV
jgi:hypothetical protein